VPPCREHARLAPNPDRAEREMEPRRELLLREIYFLRKARTVGTRRARASCAPVAGGQSGSDSAARCRSALLIASKARHSVLGGRFGLSLNFVIVPLFMRLGPAFDQISALVQCGAALPPNRNGRPLGITISTHRFSTNCTTLGGIGE
jgi:hypothetical protein